MPKYAYFDHTQPAPQRVIGWLDTDALTYATMPATADLLELTVEQFAARMPNPSGWVVNAGALIAYVAPPPPPPTLQQQALALLGQPINLVCTSVPSINGAYPIDQATQAQITGIAAAINAGMGLPGGEATFNWAGHDGWPAVQFTAYAKAVMNFCYACAQVAQGNSETLPSQTLTIA
jgi:hypothetical protein